MRMAVEGKVDAIDGTPVSFRPRTLCVHGDSPNALETLLALREVFAGEAVQVIMVGGKPK